MPIKGGYLLAAGGGAILIWSGFRGKSVSGSLRDVISGKNPQTLTTAYPIRTSKAAYNAGPASGSGAYGYGSQQGGISAPSGPGESAFWSALLTSLAIPPTPGAIKGLVAWRTKECPWNSSPPDGALYTHNPLNTTLSMPGAVSINSVGVKKYPNTLVGLAATRQTLRGYPQIMAALRRGNLCGSAAAGDFSRWSGGGYSSVC